MAGRRSVARAAWGSLGLSALLLAGAGCPPAQRLTLPEDRPSGSWVVGREQDVEVDPDEPVVFAVLGDVGQGSAAQRVVADSVARVCRDRCGFVLLLGDNLYEAGLDGPDAEESLACIVGSYPTDRKYLVLGNHDYTIISPSLERARRELTWIRREASSRHASGARGRYHFYQFEAGPLRLVGLDTNYLVRGKIDLRYRDIHRWLGPLPKREEGWTLVFGHHPFRSNGAHGNAGDFHDGGRRIWPGRFFEHFMDKHVIGRADMYLAGHDHNLQFLEADETALVVSGSGARCRGRGRADNDATFEHYGLGFALVEATAQRLAITFYDLRGGPLWGAHRTKELPWRALEGFEPRRVSIRNRCAEDEATARELAADRGLDCCTEGCGPD